MNRKIFFASLVVVLLLATAVLPASAAQPEASPGVSLAAPIGPVKDGAQLVFPLMRIQPKGDCESGGNCSG